MHYKPITPGRRFGRLIVIGRDPERRVDGHARWLCQCDCGNMTSLRSGQMTTGMTASCGCLRLERVSLAQTTHGESKRTPEYVLWLSMHDRCRNPKNKAYHRYGGRGITVCERWRRYENFLADMGRRPFPKASLERIDNDRGYEPGNVRWASHKEQMRNMSRNRLLTFNGETLAMVVWAERLGISYRKLEGRIGKGWSAERALTEP